MDLFNASIEASILSYVLTAKESTVLHDARKVLVHPLMFGATVHQAIWFTILSLDDEGLAVDTAMVEHRMSRIPHGEYLAAMHQIERSVRDRTTPWDRSMRRHRRDIIDDHLLSSIGGMPSITKLLTAAPLKALFQRNLTIVADDAKRRLTMMIIDGMRDRVTGRDKMDDVLSDAMAALGDVSLTGSSVRAHTFQSVVTEIAAKRRERDANPSSDGPCMGTMTAIDTALGPLRPGGLYILAARPGVGKTSRALETCIQSIRDNQQRQVAFISLEVDRSDIVGKMIASQNRVSFRDYEQMSHEQLTVASSKLDFLEGHLDIIDKSHVTPQELMITCREIMLRRKRLDLVVVDYLQLLSAGSHGKDDVERISYISRSLKVLAKDLRVPVLALSQMSRDSEKGAAQGRPPREPRLTDLRGSGSIEQDADAVCFIHRAIEHEAHPSEDSPVRVIKYILAKNRFGPQSEAWSDFNAKIMSFTPRDEPNPVKTEDEQDPHMKILRERRDKQRPAMPFRMGIPADEHPIESRHDDNDDDDGFFGETGPARPLTAPPASTKPHPGHDNASQPSSSPTWRDL